MRRETWPLVGRADELAYVARALEEHRAVVLAGAPGVGKSRLAAELTANAAVDGWSTVTISVGSDSAAVPFSPFASLLGEGASDEGVDRILNATRAVEARGGRVLVSVDDAHLLDDVSIAFLRHLLAATTVRLLLTVRSGTPAPEGLQSMWQRGELYRVDVQPLSRSEVTDLLDLVLGAPVDLAVVRWVWLTSEGNTLFVRELVLDAIDRGTLVQRDGRWTLTSPSDGPGSRLLEVVASRVGSVPGNEHEALELLAVGEPLGLHLFEDLVGADIVQSLERRGLVRTTVDSSRAQIHFAHPLHGEVLRDGLGISVARQLRRQLIDAVAATGAKRATDTLRLATWRCETGDTGDWKALLDAANDLSRAFSRPLAALWTGGVAPADAIPVGRSHLEVSLRLARAALDAGGSIEAAALVWSLLMRLGRRDEAMALDAEVDAIAVTENDRLRAARMRAEAAFFYDTGTERALAELRVMAGTALDPSARVGATASLSQLLVLVRSMREASELGLAAFADENANAYDRMVAAASAASALSDLGETAQAMRLLDDLTATITGDEDSNMLGILLAVRVVVLVNAGRFLEAEQQATLGMQVAAATGSDDGTAVFAAELASISLTLGRPASAAKLATEVTLRLAEHDDVFGVRRAGIVAGTHAHALLGNVDEVDIGLTALTTGSYRDRWAADDEIRTRAWADIARGRASAALARLEAGAERAALEERTTSELRLLHDLVRLGHAHVVVDRIEELAARNDSATSPLIAAQARGVVSRDTELLETAAEGFASLGCRLSAAEAWAQASVVHDAAGKRTAAANAAARSRAAVEECEGARTPAIATGGASDNLTAREREIAGLAARGLTDKQIAEELVVSTRTVQTHLYNAYAKLGVDGRAGLADVL